jgi:integrase
VTGVWVARRGRRWGLIAYAGREGGRKRYRWLGTYATRREAEMARAAAATHPLFAAGLGVAGNPRLRLEQHLLEWIDHREAVGGLRPHGAAHYRQLMRRHVLPRMGHVPLARISPPMVCHLHAALARAGLAGSTVRQIGSILHAALREAVAMGLVAKNPCDQAPLPRARDPEITPPTLEQIHRYLEDARETATPAVFAFYVAMAATGARPGELLGAAEDAFDPRAGTLRILRTLTRAGPTPPSPRPRPAAARGPSCSPRRQPRPSRTPFGGSGSRGSAWGRASATAACCSSRRRAGPSTAASCGRGTTCRAWRGWGSRPCGSTTCGTCTPRTSWRRAWTGGPRRTGWGTPTPAT